MGAVGNVRGPYSAAWQLFDLENFSCMLFTDPDVVHAALTACTDFSLTCARHMAEMGVDAIPDAKNAVAGGTLAATVLQDAEGQGGGAVGVVSSVLAGEAVEPITWVPFVLITPENIADFQ
jgi:ABC-type sugar transport system substrate-binding protein